MRTYSDDQLIRAVAESSSWRGVLRHLGLTATSGAASRSVKRNAIRLELDYRHFTGQRRWSDRQLADAVARNDSWTDVQYALGLSDGGSTTALRAHALRLGLDTGHLSRSSFAGKPKNSTKLDRANLRRAGSMLAAAWFELSGAQVAWPLEPCRYDLLVSRDRATRRVQIKTTTSRAAGQWTASLCSTSTRDRIYDPDDIDDFFIIDGDLAMYLIPIEAVAGFSAIQLSAYTTFQVTPLTSANV
jgi:hypothetical protein